MSDNNQQTDEWETSSDGTSYDGNYNFKHDNKRLPDYLNFAMDPISQRICINAVTGQKYYDPTTNKPIYNNSFECRQLYAVIDATAPLGERDPYKLYYDTPEQYERHRRVKVPRKRKEIWRAKMTELGYSPFGIGNVATNNPEHVNDSGKVKLSNEVLAYT